MAKVVAHYEAPLKMIVDTDFTKPSGDKGGVPMFSRFGKATCAESLVFTNHDEDAV